MNYLPIFLAEPEPITIVFCVALVLLLIIFIACLNIIFISSVFSHNFILCHCLLIKTKYMFFLF